jgi:hypothetical protein
MSGALVQSTWASTKCHRSAGVGFRTEGGLAVVIERKKSGEGLRHQATLNLQTDRPTRRRIPGEGGVTVAVSGKIA